MLTWALKYYKAFSLELNITKQINVIAIDSC